MAVEDNGNGRGRVTNAELDRALADLHKLMAARFDTVQVQLGVVTAVAARVSDLERENRATGLHLVSMQDQLNAVSARQSEQDNGRTFWRRNWPSLALATLAVAFAALGYFI